MIVTADHGEEFLEHGGTGHTHTCYEEVLRIPLIVHVPWIAAARRVTEHVSLLDLFPTVLELAGAPRDQLTMQALSLVPALTKDRAIPPRFLMAETRMGQLAGQRGNMSSLLTAERLKFLYFSAPQPAQMMFDLQRDPAETRDLTRSASATATAQTLAARLAAAHADNRRWNEAFRLGREDSLTPELSETLKGLGYVQ